ncbi:hypothetical protein [Agromyces binzhouensis]|uniref:hypothetical protein n=1 Tax=Agromyces binzhouensis TaxID=1817495 RepID=UPI00363684EB
MKSVNSTASLSYGASASDSTSPASSTAKRTVEKHVTNLFNKLGLGEDESIHRRVLAVLTFLRTADGTESPDH